MAASHLNFGRIGENKSDFHRGGLLGEDGFEEISYGVFESGCECESVELVEQA